MSYTVIITEEVAANVEVTTQNYPITIEYNATNINNTNAYGNANVAAYLASGTDTANIITTANIAGGNISTTGRMSATGNITGGNVLSNGFVLASGNVTGNYFLGNGSQLTGLPETYSNANVAAYLASGNVTTNIETTGNIAANVIAANVITASGNVTGAYILGNGSQLTGLPATYSNANVTTLLAAFGSNTISTTGNITGGNVIGNGSALTNLTGANVSGTVANATYATSAGSATTAGTANTALNVSAANVTGTFGSISATGNITSQSGNIEAVTGQFIGNGSGITIVLGGNVHGAVAEAQQVTGATQANITAVGTLTSLSVSGNIVGGNVNTAGQISAGGNVTANNYSTGGLVSATGNVTGGNVLSLGTVTAAGNLMSTQQTIVGTANVGTTGNIVVSGKNIATDMAWVPDNGTAVTNTYGRVLVGTGWAGNVTHNAQQHRMTVSDAITRGNNSTSLRALASEQFVSITGNVSNNNWRQQSLGGYLRIGGGSAANTVSSASTTLGVPFMVAAGQFNIDVGNIAPYNLGNTSISHATVNGGIMQFGGNSYVANAFGVYSAMSTAFGATVTGNVLGNVLGYSSAVNTGAIPTGNVYAFYHPSTTNRYGPVTGSQIQAAPQYYAFYNEDDHAQIRLGSLRTYHETRNDLATSGTVNIDKANGQIQYIRPTGNVTIGSFQNFVTETATTYETDYQIDTVTFMIAQGATPYTVTMPTGNAAIKYAGNTSAVANTANAVTMVSVSAANIAGTKTYMVTVSPEFV